MSDEGAAAWLRQVIEGDKAAALAATPGPWAFEGDDITDDELYSVHNGEHGDLVGQTVAFTRDRQVENGQHMARQNPLNVIARCESDLVLLDLHKPVSDEYVDGDGDTRDSLLCDECDNCGAAFNWPCRTARLLARGYRHREGYADHWGALAAKESV